jgi:hypothetical protein
LVGGRYVSCGGLAYFIGGPTAAAIAIVLGVVIGIALHLTREKRGSPSKPDLIITSDWTTDASNQPNTLNAKHKVALGLLALVAIFIVGYVFYRYLGGKESEMTARVVKDGPDFSRSVVDCIAVDKMERHDGTIATAVALGVEIRNTGAESAITNYDETSITPQGKTFLGTFTNINAVVQFNPHITLSPGFALEPKTQVPIVKGSIVKGWLLFDFNVLPEEANAVGTVIVLHFEDVFGGDYTVRQKLTTRAAN